MSPFLLQAEWDLQTALETFYTANATDDPIRDSDYQPDEEPDTSDLSNTHGYGGTTGRTLGGDGVASRAVPSDSDAPRPIPTASSSGARARGGGGGGGGGGGMRTLRDLQGSASGDSGQGHSHDDEDDEDEDKDQDMFAGGEKSGLAVQNPNSGRSGEDHINQILRRAAQNRPRPGGDDEERPVRPSHFRGHGQTLGSEETPSTIVPSASQPSSSTSAAPRVHRELHLWRNGFSVDDGPLFRFDDPANAAVLEMINRGRAPLDLLGVEQGQEVDLQVHPHREEDYKPPPKKYRPFGGEGQRLGSPTPALSSSSSTSHALPTAAANASSSGSGAGTQPTLDESAPTVTLQIRLGDGSQLRSRFNTTHTIGDVYEFVNAASTASTQRSYALMTTFPSKELTDKAQVLGDMAEFKRGGVVVQKWL